VDEFRGSGWVGALIAFHQFLEAILLGVLCVGSRRRID
jgi:hypothetical protein